MAWEGVEWTATPSAAHTALSRQTRNGSTAARQRLPHGRVQNLAKRPGYALVGRRFDGGNPVRLERQRVEATGVAVAGALLAAVVVGVASPEHARVGGAVS